MLHLHHRRRWVVVRHREALESGLSRQGWRCKKSVAWVRPGQSRRDRAKCLKSATGRVD